MLGRIASALEAATRTRSLAQAIRQSGRSARPSALTLATPTVGSASVVRLSVIGLDDLQQRDGGVDDAVLLCGHCDSEPSGPLAASASLS
jgi:hypothetical protein